MSGELDVEDAFPLEDAPHPHEAVMEPGATERSCSYPERTGEEDGWRPTDASRSS
jgi:hypothetical protein